jgi:glycosyltransferase involved in cell wall biosynthesis
MESLRRLFRGRWGNSDGFPDTGDAQDHTYLTMARPSDTLRRRAPRPELPSISLVVPSFNQGRFLGRALDSALAQGYPGLEVSVMDGGSSDGTAAVLREYSHHLSRVRSGPDGGPAQAINEGLRASRGDVLGWLSSDDALATDALWHVAEAFAGDPELDMVFGNALFVDEEDRVHPADHGWHRTGLYYGELQPWDRIPYYWSYVHAVPQPTVFFRRRLLERCGFLDESFRLIYDFELFWRFTRVARVAKLEHILAFYRIHAGSRTGGGWRQFQVELYRFSRPRWPPLPTPAFYHVWRDFVGCYMRHRYAGRPRGAGYWATAAAVAAAALVRAGNPEGWDLPRPTG